MTSTAQLFLESTTVSEFEGLKSALCGEFARDYSSAELHKKLNDRIKKNTESFHEYVLHMKKIAALGNIEEVSVIRYIVDGLRIRNDQKHFLYRCKNYKDLKEEYEIIERATNTNKQIEQSKNNEWKKSSVNLKREYCFNCGSQDHKKKDCQTDAKCFKCNKFGHISKNCFNTEKNVNIIVDQNRLKKVLINGTEVDSLIDTGADVSIVAESVFKSLKGVVLCKSESNLCGFGNAKTKPIGRFEGEVAVDNMRTKQTFEIVPDNTLKYKVLLGFDFTQKFYFTSGRQGYVFTGLISDTSEEEDSDFYIYNVNTVPEEVNAPLPYQETIKKFIDGYKPITNTNISPVTLKIVADVNLKPFRQAPSRLPQPESDAVKEQVSEWLKKGIVRKSTSNFASRLVVVKKKDSTFRVCVDFRKLNSMVLKDCFPLPLIDDVLGKLHSAKYFAVMDLENGFFHVPIEENSKKYTAFITKEGLFEFNKAPFGFCNSPAVFIRYVNHIFQDLINQNVMELYMDDIVIFANTIEATLEKIKVVLATAEQWGLQIKWKKCSFLQQRIDFLGHTVENGKVWPGKEKINAVKNFPVPKNIKAVQSFLGLTGFFRKFIKGCATISRPLTNLLRKDTEFCIGPAELRAIQQLKEALTNEPVLRLYDRNKETELHTDASKDGFGANLMQVFDGELHPVFYWSKKTTIRESQQHSYMLEVKAAVSAVKFFRHYLLGIRFKLVTDCIAFKQTTQKKEVPREVTQWVLYLQDFDYTIEHRAGTRMRHVDALSRYPQDVYLISTEITARLRCAQQNDEGIKAITEVLKNQPYGNYKIRSGILYKVTNGLDLLVVPKLMEREIIENAHGIGHFAVQKTIHTIQQNYCIPHLENKVSKVINNCIKCILHSKKLGKKEGWLHSIDKGDFPLHTLHIDHLGPMDATSKQYKYVFAMVDAFSKFVWLYSTKSTGQEEVIKKLEEWSSIFGNPIRIISDKGPSFTSNAFKEYTEANQIEHILTTTGVPRGNGQIERVNRSILAIVSKLSSDEPSKWYKFIPQVQKAINSYVHSSIKRSPFEVMFGVKMNNNVNSRMLACLQEEMINSFDIERQQLREDARAQIVKAQETYKKQFDKKRKDEVGYNVGDLVAIKRTQFVAGKKLASEFLGPYKIIKVKRNGRYDVQKAADTEGPTVTSTSCDNMRLWRYIRDDEVLSSGTDDELQDGRM